MGIAALHEGQGGITGIPFPSRESTVRLLRWGNGIRPAVPWGRVLFAPGGNGKGRNVPAFFRVLWKAQRDGVGCTWRRWLLANIYLYLKGIYERYALAKKGRYAIPGRKNPKEAIMIDFKVDESLCVSCGACVKDCLHQALRMDTYPVMVDEGHCIRCQHCLAVCPTGAVSIMGAAALIARRLRATSGAPPTGYAVWRFRSTPAL